MNVQSKKKMVYMTRINPFQSEVGLLHQFFLNGGISGSVVECLIYINITIINPFQSAVRLLHQVEKIRYFSMGVQWLSGRVLDIYMTRVNIFQSAVGQYQVEKIRYFSMGVQWSSGRVLDFENGLYDYSWPFSISSWAITSGWENQIFLN